MAVHAGAGVAEDGFGHEGDGFAVLVGDVPDDVFVGHHVVGRFDEGVVALVDFALAGGGDFVVVALDDEAAGLHDLDHFGAEILVVIGRGDGEVAFFVAGAIAVVVGFAAGVPAALLGVDVVVAGVGGAVEADVIEDEEFAFGADEAGVGEAGGAEVGFRFLGDVAGIAFVGLAGDGIFDHAGHDEGGDLVEGVHHGGIRIGDENHVRFVDGGPAADGGAVDAEALFEGVFGEHGDGVGDVVLEAGDIGEAHIQLLSAVFLGERENVLRTHGGSG